MGECGEIQLIRSVQADTCVARLTTVMCSPRLLPAFEDVQNTVHRPLACHFSQVIYLACAWVTTAAFDLWCHYSDVDHWLITDQQTVIGYEKNRVSHPYPNAQPLNLLFFAAWFLLVILRKCCKWRTQQRNAQTCDNHQTSHSDHSELQHANKQPVSLTIHFLYLPVSGHLYRLLKACT